MKEGAFAGHLKNPPKGRKRVGKGGKFAGGEETSH